MPTPAPAPGPLSPYVDALERAVEDLRKHAATPPAPNLSAITEREFEARIDEHGLENLFALDDVLQDRIVRRCRYDALVRVAETLADTIASARSENRLQRYSDEDRPDGISRFRIGDVRLILAEAADRLQVGDAWRVYTASKADD